MGPTDRIESAHHVPRNGCIEEQDRKDDLNQETSIKKY